MERIMGIKEFIIPAIDLQEGKAVRLYKGDKNSSKVYSDNPVSVAKLWEDKGAKQLHIVDLDGAFEGKPKNYKIVEEIVKAVSIPVEFGGGLRSFEAIKTMFDVGVLQADFVFTGSLLLIILVIFTFGLSVYISISLEKSGTLF